MHINRLGGAGFAYSSVVVLDFGSGVEAAAELDEGCDEVQVVAVVIRPCGCHQSSTRLSKKFKETASRSIDPRMLLTVGGAEV